jgi:hypothetical protein
MAMRALYVAALVVIASGKISAQTRPPERLHPELVDRNWGPRVQGAWQRAFALDWNEANALFEALHRDQPDAVEPVIGLGFVARGRGRFADARRHFRDALALDSTSVDARDQLAAAEWDRPGRFEVGGGAQRFNGETKTTASVVAVVPITPAFTVTAGGGVFGAGDPLRGIFVDSINGASRTTMVSGGVVVKAGPRVTFGARGERWAGGGNTETFAWGEAALRLTTSASIRAGVRPVAGDNGATQIVGGVDLAPTPKALVSVDVTQGTEPAPFEARTIARLFVTALPNNRTTLRAAVVRDIDDDLSATTLGAAITWLATPARGVRIDVSNRTGAFAQTLGSISLLLRW